jgi:hypothetical protein
MGTAMLLKNLSLVERNCKTSPSSDEFRTCTRMKKVGEEAASRLGDLRKFTPAFDNKFDLPSDPTSNFVRSARENILHALT